MNADPLDELLGIDMGNPLHRLACQLVDSDDALMLALRRAREEAGLSIDTVAERMGIRPHFVRELERPGCDPSMSTIRRYALAIGVMVEHHVSPPSPVDEGNPDR